MPRFELLWSMNPTFDRDHPNFDVSLVEREKKNDDQVDDEARDKVPRNFYRRVTLEIPTY